MSHYGNYIKEIHNIDIIEDDKGFASYEFLEDGVSCYIRDIYIAPEYRSTKAALSYALQITEIAKNKGCNRLIGSVDPLSKTSSDSVKTLFGFGMSLLNIHGPLIYFVKEI
jgi:hypothetical protein